MPESQNINATEKNSETQEEWLLANIQDPTIPVNTFTSVLSQLYAAGQTERANSVAELLLETFAARRDETALLAVLNTQATGCANDRFFAANCVQQLIAFFKDDPLTLALIPHTGFNQNGPATECLRRFALLRQLRPGTLCYEKTWGFGIVVALDDYARQVVINFEKKSAHRLSLSYAAETLTVLTEDHILARRHRDGQAFSNWLAQDPAGVVICALQSFGPMSVVQLQELMIANFMPAEAWKKFWDAARQPLKQNPLVEFPVKRKDALRLLEKAKSYDATWLKKLGAERDFGHIIELVEDIKTAQVTDAWSQEQRATVEDRLAFVIRGASKLEWGQAAQAGMLGYELGITWGLPGINDYITQFLQDKVFLDTLRSLPARRLRPFFAFVHAIGGAKALSLFLRVMPEIAYAALAEIIEYLQNAGQMPQVTQAMRTLLGKDRASCEMLYWLCRHMDMAQSSGISTTGNLAMEILALLETREATGERLKAKHQLRALFEQPHWLKAALDAMTAGQRTDFMRRLKNSSAWAEIDRRAIMARILKLYPDLSVVLQDEAATPLPAARLTSLRSYRERQALLTKIVTQDIPKNSQDIAVARSFGDLRENFEYKSAKEMQGILLHRQAELESQLACVKGTDFENLPSDVAGPGTSVTLRQTDGKTKIYYILGEWDSDEQRGILSARCKVGEALTGHRPGDTVTIPGETGDSNCILLEVGRLPPDIKAWIRGNA